MPSVCSWSKSAKTDLKGLKVSEKPHEGGGAGGSLHNCKIKHKKILEKCGRPGRKRAQLLARWMPSDSAGWHAAAQICWLRAWGLAFGMIHGFRDNKSLRWSSPSFHRVHYHFICTEEPKHISPWPSGSLSQARRDPAVPQRWQLQIAGAAVWIITCSCLVSQQGDTEITG